MRAKLGVIPILIHTVMLMTLLRLTRLTFAVFTLVGLSVASRPCQAEEPTDRETRLADYLSSTAFEGKFTVDGNNGDPKTERYTIKSCEKLPTKDLYRMKAHIKYGSVDQEVPLDLKILWSGSTPVITLESIWIPGMGTFDAHVLIRGDRYAGTWQHGEKGGHLFGKIVPVENDTSTSESK